MALTYQVSRRRLLQVMKGRSLSRIACAAAILVLAPGLTACWHKDTTKQACQSMKDVSFDSVIGHLYDGASDSFKHEYDKVDGEASGNAGYYYDLQRLDDLCAKYGVKKATSSMTLG